MADLPTDTYGEALSKQNSPFEISRDISSKNPKELQESDGGNPMGSAVKKNGRGGICERKLLKAVLNWD